MVIMEVMGTMGVMGTMELMGTTELRQEKMIMVTMGHMVMAMDMVQGEEELLD